MKYTCFLVILFFFVTIQGLTQNTPLNYIDIVPVDPTCEGQSIQLIAVVNGVYGTESYTFEPFEYSPEPYEGGTSVVMSDDDVYPDDDIGLDIGFDFCFLNVTVNKFWIGSNGWISFSPGQTISWTPQPLPTTNAPMNAILAPWQDWDPSVGAGPYIFYKTEGTAPDRKLIVYWKDCPMYSSPCHNRKGWFQIVLHETTNVIDNHITHKPSCTEWNGNLATQGIQNADATQAYIAFDRNQTSWTTDYESTHFVPSGITWHQDTPDGEIIGRGNKITVTATVSTTYWATLATCDNSGTYQASVDVIVYPAPLPVITGPDYVCANQEGLFITQSGQHNYLWGVPDPDAVIVSGGTVFDNSITLKWTSTGIRTVSLQYTESQHECQALMPAVKTVTVQAAPNPTINTGGPACLGVQTSYQTEDGPGISGYVWTVSSGGTIVGGINDQRDVSILWNTLGPGQWVRVSYSNGICTASSEPLDITVHERPVPAVLTGPSLLCEGPALVHYTTASGMQNYVWSVSGGIISDGQGTDAVTIEMTGAGTKTVTVNYLNEFGCNGVPVPYPVLVKPTPVLTNTPTEKNICSLENTNIQLQATVPGTGFTWTISSTTGSVSGYNPNSDPTKTEITDVLTNSGTTTGTVTYLIVPHADGCDGPAASFTVYVKPLPIPVITGENSVCIGVPAKIYSTETGKLNYLWTIPPEATVTAGGTTTDNTVTITWNTVGNYSISVNYTEPSTQCTASTPSIHTVTVNPLPIPTFSGENSVCIGVPGKIYTTQSGKQDYVWTIPPQATITGGGTSTDNTATITWNAVGTYSIGINYSEPGTLCTAVNPGTYTVTVNALPTPTFTAGESPVCIGVAGKTYITQSGKSDYVWTIPPEATVTAGGTSTDNSVTVTWNTVGSYTISVNYTEPSTQCTAVNPTPYNVTVNPLPAPSFTSGVSPVCVGVAGKTYVTQSGKSSYVWTIPPQATITAGGTSSSNSVTLTWNAIGNYTLSVNYTEPSTQCTAVSPTTYNVTVNPLPVPTITGPAAPCLNVPVQYSTEDLMTGYTWSVSPGGTILSALGSLQVQVNWSAIGNRTISVNYFDPNGCTAVLPTTLNVNVNTLPVPTITGDNPVCERFTSTYTTEPGAQSYSWTLPTSGVTIISGGGTTDNTVTIQWNTPGAYSISVNYVISTGCTAPQPTIFPVTVKPSPTPTFVQGTPELCQGATGVVYSTQTGMSNYAWTVSAGGTITSGGAPVSSSVTVTWTTPGAQSLSVNYANSNGCTALVPTVFNVTVNPLPMATFTGTYTVCQLHPDPYLYTADAGPLCSYSWSIIPNTSGTVANPSANPASITWNIAGNAVLRLDAITGSGCTSFSTKLVQVNPRADVSITTCFDPVTSRSAKPFLLKGGKPLLTGSPQQGEYLISPSTSALYYSSGYYYFDPSIVPGSSITVFTITYKYTNQYGCPATTTGSVPLTVRGPNPACGSSMTDYRDGTSYRTSLVAGKCWMMENLRYGSTLIPTTKAQTDNCTTERYCLSSDANCSAYGGLYQWDELIQYGQTSGPDYQGVCPPGWHVPSSLDWQNLINASGGNGLAAGPLTDLNLTPEGFEALLKGIYYMNTTWAFTVTDLPKATMFWTSTPGSGSRFITRGINSKNPSTSLYESSKANAFPVRCLRD